MEFLDLRKLSGEGSHDTLLWWAHTCLTPAGLPSALASCHLKTVPCDAGLADSVTEVLLTTPGSLTFQLNL